MSNRVLVAGDWHGNTPWAERVLTVGTLLVPEARVLLHVGDFGFWGERSRRYVDRVNAIAIERDLTVLVTPGNHEDWGALTKAMTAQPGSAVKIAERVQILPRGYEISLAGRTLLSFGGAASVDFERRVPGVDWFLEECPTDGDVERVLSSHPKGSVDVLITHDTVDGGTPSTETQLRSNPQGWSEYALAYSAGSRGRVTQVWNGLAPSVLLHGHMHMGDVAEVDNGRTVISLDRDGSPRNMGVLNLDSLEFTWLREVDRGARRHPPLVNVESVYLTRPENTDA